MIFLYFILVIIVSLWRRHVHGGVFVGAKRHLQPNHEVQIHDFFVYMRAIYSSVINASYH